LLAYRELDDALGLTEMAGETLADARTGRNGRHALVGLLRQSVFGRLAGYEDVNDAERSGQRLTVRQHRRATWAASKLSGWRHQRTSLLLPTCLASGSSLCTAAAPPRGIVLDMDSSVSPTHGEQEMSVWNGHYACAYYHPLFVFNQFGDLERSALRPGNVHSADG
jgi:Transposase DDE domain group 1